MIISGIDISNFVNLNGSMAEAYLLPYYEQC